jgi:hypothetical protein
LKTFDEISGYVWRADTYCPKCLRTRMYHEGVISKTMKSQTTEDMLDLLADDLKINREDEWTFDSDIFPKIVFKSDAEFMPDFCTRCEKFV